MARDIRDPFVVYSATAGFRGTGFTVVPSNTVLLGAGHYVMVPVLNEQAGDELIAEMRRRADQPKAPQIELSAADCRALAIDPAKAGTYRKIRRTGEKRHD